MPNHAAASRRPRTAAGANPPNIALTLTQVFATSRTFLATLSCCTDITTHRVSQELSARLREAPLGSHRDVVVSTLDTLATTHGCPPLAASRDLPQVLNDVWDASSSTAALDDVVSSAIEDGYDAERLCWDVISRESLAHIGLIRKEASKVLRTLPERGADELMGYGWTGLRMALRKYDPALGFAFSTYACHKINGSIRDGVRDENPLPKRLTTVQRAVQASEAALAHDLQRTPSYAEIAENLKFTAKQSELLPRLAPAASLEELSSGWGEKSREPMCLVDVCDPAEETDRILLIEEVQRAIADLPDEEAQAVRLLCLEEMTINAAAEVMGIEARRLKVVKRRAMVALAASLGHLSEDLIPA